MADDNVEAVSESATDADSHSAKDTSTNATNSSNGATSTDEASKGKSGKGSKKSDHAVVRFEDVEKEYTRGLFGRPVTALRGVSLEIRKGAVTALLGPNRAGKTTLLKILLGICQASGGTVTRFGQPENNRSTLARIGYVHENQHFPSYLTANQLLHLYGLMSGVESHELRKQIPERLKQVGLSDRADEPIWTFSKGMGQRLGLAQALLGDPDLLVLDEPSEGLDQFGREMIRRVMRKQRNKGRSIILVTHVLPEVEELADDLAVVFEGRLIFSGALAEFRKDPKTGKTRSLEGSLEVLYREHSK